MSNNPVDHPNVPPIDPVNSSNNNGDITQILNQLLENKNNTPNPPINNGDNTPPIDEGAEAVKRQAKLEKDFRIEKQSKMKSRVLKRRYAKMDGEIKVYFDTNVANMKEKTSKEQYKRLKEIAFEGEKLFGPHKEIAQKSKNFKSFLKAEKEFKKKQNDIAKLNTHPTLNGLKNGSFKNNLAMNEFLKGKKILS